MEDLGRVASATGAKVQTTVNNLDRRVLGSCATFEEKQARTLGTLGMPACTACSRSVCPAGTSQHGHRWVLRCARPWGSPQPQEAAGHAEAWAGTRLQKGRSGRPRCSQCAARWRRAAGQRMQPNCRQGQGQMPCPAH